MKFLHLADLHLGRRLNEFDLLDDQRYILAQIAELCGQRAVEAVLISGDVYDKPVPSAGAVELLDDFLSQLTEKKIPVLVISGNHDSGERLDFGRRQLQAGGLHVCGAFRGAPACVTLHDAHGPVHFYSLPFVKAATVGHFLPEADTSTYDAAIAAALAGCPACPEQRNVLLAHQFVTAAGHTTERAGSESPALNLGTVEQVDAACFAAFDYVALGHIHRPQKLGRPTLRYAGSPLCYSLAEAGQQKSVPLVTLGPKGQTEVELLPLTPRRALRHLTGTLEALLQPQNVQQTDDYIYVTLTDPAPVMDAIGRVRSVYPNTLHLDYQARAGAPTLPSRAVQLRQKSFEELFGEFYTQMTGAAPTEEEWQAVRQTLQEVEKP